MLDALLKFVAGIQTWSRAGIVLVLGFALLAGYLVLQYPQRLFELIQAGMNERPPERLPYMTPLWTDVNNELTKLMEEFGSHMLGVVAFRVDVLTNQQRLVAAQVVEMYQPALKKLMKDRWNYPAPAFRDDPVVNHILIRLYLGKFVCVAPRDTWRTVQQFPIQEICLIAIPPEGLGLAGYLAGGWDEKIPDPEKTRVEVAFRRAANTLVWRNYREEAR